jgi:hypothetical protein
MWNRRVHPPDEQLLRFAERELSSRRTAAIREHVAQCQGCRKRIVQFQATLADFVSLHEESLPSQPSFRAELRAALKARLSAEKHPAAVSSSWRHATSPRQFIAACAALLVLAASLLALRNSPLHVSSQSAASQLASGLPERRLTPGVAHAIRVEDLCGSPGVSNDPPLSPSLEQAVFREYGLPVSSKDHYEVDYLISPSLGGTEDIRNLWPEPSSTTSWDARVKDELENHLHTLVCQGKLPLETAQKEIAGDWIAAYKRYFHTDTPLSDAATLIGRQELNLPAPETLETDSQL